MENIFIGRQPIYDRNLQVYAYELLFRSGEANRAGVIDGDHATSQVMINAFVDIGLENLIGEHLAFINLTRNFLVGRWPLPFSSKQVVLEVLEDIEPEPEVIAAVQDLVKRGYTVALDDFVYRDDYRPLIALSQVVKMDLLATPVPTLAAQLQRIRAANPKVRLLAEKVETQEEFDQCKALGFDYFQGYFFCKPHIVQGARLPPNRLVVLNLLAKLHDPEVEVADLERVLIQDVALTYRLLRYINSAAIGLRTRVDSVQRAIMLLGLKTIRQLVSLILMTRVEDKPQELMVTTLVRAKMCERLCELRGRKGKEAYFTVGLFSNLEAMMDRPLAELLEKLPLDDTLKAALLGEAGDLGEVLHQVLEYERADWDALQREDSADTEQLRTAYLEAVRWADENVKALSQAA